MVGRSRTLVALSSCLRLRSILAPRSLSSTASKNPDKAAAAAGGAAAADAAARVEAYRQVHDLDFPTAAKILFNTPPKRKSFGFDFHLVQFFFACMPSLAVFLVAQYARYEIRRMEGELELKKKKAEEEEKLKAAELESREEESKPGLSKVIVRLDALEEAVKEIVDERKNAPPLDTPKDKKVNKKEQIASAESNSSSQSKTEAGAVLSEKSSNMVGDAIPTHIPHQDGQKQDQKAEKK